MDGLGPAFPEVLTFSVRVSSSFALLFQPYRAQKVSNLQGWYLFNNTPSFQACLVPGTVMDGRQIKILPSEGHF